MYVEKGKTHKPKKQKIERSSKPLDHCVSWPLGQLHRFFFQSNFQNFPNPLESTTSRGPRDFRLVSEALEELLAFFFQDLLQWDWSSPIALLDDNCPSESSVLVQMPKLGLAASRNVSEPVTWHLEGLLQARFSFRGAYAYYILLLYVNVEVLSDLTL